MKYIKSPRPRWLLVLPICFALIPLVVLSGLTLGAFRGYALWCDLMDWAHYQ